MKTSPPSRLKKWLVTIGFVAAVLVTLVALAVAVLLNQGLAGASVFRTLFYLPHLVRLRTATPNLEAVFWHAASRTASSTYSRPVSPTVAVTPRLARIE